MDQTRENDLYYKIKDYNDENAKDFNNGQTKTSQQTQAKTAYKRLSSKRYLITSSSSSSTQLKSMTDTIQAGTSSSSNLQKGTLRLSVDEGKYSSSKSITFPDKKKKHTTSTKNDPIKTKVSNGGITKRASPVHRKKSQKSDSKPKSTSPKTPQPPYQLSSVRKRVFKPLNLIKIEKGKTVSVSSTAASTFVNIPSSLSSVSSKVTSKSTTATKDPTLQEAIKIDTYQTGGLDDLVKTITKSCNDIQSFLSSGSTSILYQDVLKKRADEFHCSLQILVDTEIEMKDSKAATACMLVTSTEATNDEGYTIAAGSKIVVTKGILINQRGTVEGFNDAGRAVIKMDSYSAEDIVSDWYRYLPLSVLRPSTPSTQQLSTSIPATTTTVISFTTLTTSTSSTFPAIISCPDVKMPAKSLYDRPKFKPQNIDNRESSTSSRLPDIKLSTCPWLTSTQIENLEQHGIQGIRSLMTSNPVFVQAATRMSKSSYAGLMNRFLTCYYTPEDEPPLSSSPSLISTGFKPLDQVLGGGLQDTESIEFYGKSSTGKTQISMAIAAHFCCSTPTRTVIYFDLKHDFKATRFFSMCKRVTSALNNIQIIRSSSLTEFMTDVEEAKRNIKNKSTEFFEKVKLVVIDSVPMMIYPAVTDRSDWRRVENMVFETIKEFSSLNDGIMTFFVNHATTPWITNNKQINPQHSAAILRKIMPALGRNWKDKPDVRVLCDVDEKFDHVIHATLMKCLRVSVPQSFDFFIPPAL